MSVVRVFLITVIRILKGFNFEMSNMISHHYPHVGKTPLPKINFPGLFEVVKKKKIFFFLFSTRKYYFSFSTST